MEVSVKSIKRLLSPFGRIKNMYHAENVNMQLSFDSLKKLIEEDRGIKLGEGDVFVCDSANKRSRKALIRVRDGWLIMYYRMDKSSEMKVQRIKSV